MAIFALLFSFRGTATVFTALAVLGVALAIHFGMDVLGDMIPQHQRFFYPLVALSWVAVLTTSARRLHHAGQSGLWAMVTLLPLIGFPAAALMAILPERRTHLRANNGARAAGYALITLILLGGLWRVWWTPLWVVWQDMQPTLWVGDYVVMRAQPLTGAEGPAYSDVVAIRPMAGDDGSNALRAAKVMRVIGKGGDRVALQNGVVWLNGQPLQQLPQGEFDQIMRPQGPMKLRPKCQNGLVGDGALCRNAQLREIGPDGRGYMILDTQQGNMGDTWAEMTVPEGMIFVLGDNRDASLDSRFDAAVGGLGMVAQSNIMGHVRRVIFSSADGPIWAVWAWRMARLWRGVE